MQLQARTTVAIAQAIELLQGCNAALKYPVAPLPIDVACGIAGQGSHHGDALGRQKIGQTLLAWLRQDREVAAINHRHTHRPGLSHQLAEVGVELGGSTGEIQAADSQGLQHLGHQGQGGAIHALGTGRARIHMTVATGLVAAVAEVHLQGGELAPLDRGKHQPSLAGRIQVAKSTYLASDWADGL